MSTVKADLIQNRLGSNAPAVTKGAFLRSYCTFIYSGGVPGLRTQNLNVSSLTDNGVGHAFVNMTAPSTDGTFPAVVGSWANATWTSKTCGVMVSSNARYDTYNVENAVAVDATTQVSTLAGGTLA